MTPLEPSSSVARPDPRHTATLVALGALTVASTVTLGYVIPLSAGRLERASAALIPELPHWAFLAAHRSAALDNPNVVAAVLILASTVAFASCIAATCLLWRRGASRHDWMVIATTGILSALLNVGAMPNENSNIYNYMLRGRVAGVYGQNPYVTAASEFPDDPITPYAAARNTQYPGGKYPSWMIWNVAMARVAGDDPVTNLLAYRTMLFLFSALNLWLVARLARRLVPAIALAGFTLWAWNPIVVMNGQCRTDTVMVFYLLLGMSLLVGGKRVAAGAALGLSVLVKLLTAPLLAVAALAEIRARKWRDLAITAASAVAAMLIVGLPFLIGVTGQFADEVLYVTESTSNVVSGPDWIAIALRAGFAVLVLAIGLTRNGSWLHLFGGWAIVQLYFSLFFAKFGSADYHMTLFAIVAVTMSRWVVFPALALGFGSFLFDEWYRVGSATFHLPDVFSFDARAVLLLPLIAAAVWLILARRNNWLSDASRPDPPR
ncbi:hypothetical protein K8I85_03035 [bacterium]|nr:hypothetical protein [bacterium]